ncbi:hypothetical protein KKH27_09075 [bacterium]|nr:hypothetical protein [bacterium]MBU1983602.1 hypothetical protein [bacterium]
MLAPSRCPHCLRKISFRKRFKTRCPHCFKPTRRRSGIQDRSLIGQWLEDRSTNFWFFLLMVILGILAVTMQILGQPDLVHFIDRRTFWFVVTVYYAAMFAAIIGRIYFPLLLAAPRILRRERETIRQYKNLTTWGLIIGVVFALLVVGINDVWSRFPATVFLMFMPVAILWSYQALTLTDTEYEDERVWTFLHELGAQDRLEHRHHAYFVLVGLPLSALMFSYFVTHPVLAHMIQGSSESGILAMLADAYNRVRGR